MVQITLTSDADVLLTGQSTTVHLWAEVLDGQPGNGLYAYAFNVLFDVQDVLAVNQVYQLGEPDPFFSDDGTVEPDGLHDVYGGDGGFFTDPGRGVGEPFEVLAITVLALAPGTSTLTAEPADSAELLGIPNGILLQDPGAVDVSYDSAVSILVVPEPSSIQWLLWGLVSAAFLRRLRFA